MEAFLVSTVVVGLAEIGDKTQIPSTMRARAISAASSDRLRNSRHHGQFWAWQISSKEANAEASE